MFDKQKNLEVGKRKDEEGKKRKAKKKKKKLPLIFLASCKSTLRLSLPQGLLVALAPGRRLGVWERRPQVLRVPTPMLALRWTAEKKK